MDLRLQERIPTSRLIFNDNPTKQRIFVGSQLVFFALHNPNACTLPASEA
jgi:5'(3')-deoxyribonucleotidase